MRDTIRGVMHVNRTPAHVPVITTPLHRRPFDPTMNPPRAHTTRDLYDGSRRVSFDGERPQREEDVSSSSNVPGCSTRPDDIEREDFEEENRLLDPGMIVDRNLKYACSGKSKIAPSSETISLNDNPTDYSMPGCSKDSSDDSNSTIRRMITSRPYYRPFPMNLEEFIREQERYKMEEELARYRMEEMERKKREEEWLKQKEQESLERRRIIADSERNVESLLNHRSTMGMRRKDMFKNLIEQIRLSRERKIIMPRPIKEEIEDTTDKSSNEDKDILMPQPFKVEIEDLDDKNHQGNVDNSTKYDDIITISHPIKVEIEDSTEKSYEDNIDDNFSTYEKIVMSRCIKVEIEDSTATNSEHNTQKKLPKYKDNIIMPRPIGEKRKSSTDKRPNSRTNENNLNKDNVIMPRPIGERKESATDKSLNNRIDESDATKSEDDIVPLPIIEDSADKSLNIEENSFNTNKNSPDPVVVEEKEDFMQKLLNSNTNEKKIFPKGKLYKAEAMEGVDVDMSEVCDINTSGPSGRTNSNASSIGSTSSDSTQDISVPSTSNADKLLGLDKKSKKNELKRSKTKNYGKCFEDDSEDELNEESWCTCLSSHEDDDDDEPEQEPEPERHWRKRRNDLSPPQGAKKFCPDDSHVGSSTSEPWPTAGTSGMQASTSQDPPDLNQWLNRFASWTNSEKTKAIDALINRCAAGEVRHMMTAIEPLFQRDFISLLPKELALTVLGYLEPKDLLRSAQTCRYWRFLADDNLLWKEKCRRIGITTLKKIPRTLPRCASLWKSAYMRQYLIENNWLHKSVKSPIVMRGHDDHVITCLQFYRNRILSGSDDTTLRLWSAVTGKLLRILVGHSGGVWSSQMVGHLVISGSTDRTLRVWNAKSGHCIKVLAGHTSTVRCMHLHDNRVVSGSRDATLRVWSLPDGRCLRVLVGHIAAVRCVQFDGKYVVSGAYDYFVKVWNPDSGECLHTLSGHTNRVYSLQFDGVHVVSGSLDTSIRVWEVKTGQLKHTLTGHQSLTSGMELNSNILVSGNADSTVKVWNIATGHCLHTLAGPNKHQSAVTCLQSSNRFVITSSDDGTVKLWDVRTGEFIRNLVELKSGGSGGVVWRIRASATKLVCAVGSRNGTEETKLLVLNFDIPGACRRCNE